MIQYIDNTIDKELNEYIKNVKEIKTNDKLKSFFNILNESNIAKRITDKTNLNKEEIDNDEHKTDLKFKIYSYLSNDLNQKLKLTTLTTGTQFCEEIIKFVDSLKLQYNQVFSPIFIYLFKSFYESSRFRFNLI